MKRIEGIILKNIDYKESSKILYLYTKEGMQSLLVRGIRKITAQNRDLLMNYNVISADVSNGNLPSFISGSVIKKYPHIQNSYSTNLLVGLMMEALNLVSGNDERLYPFILKSFDRMMIDDKKYSLVFLVKLLYFLGIAPLFSYEVKQNYIGFSISSGTIVKDGEIDLDIPLTIKLYEAYTLDIMKDEFILTTEEIRRLFDFIFEYYRYHFSYTFRLEKDTKKIL